MIIQSAQHLQDFCAELQQHPVIFLDTEFVGEGRYTPEIGAIQVAVEGQAALIDPLAIRDLSPLRVLLTDPHIEKVFHAAGHDLVILYRLFDAPVTHIFDTQVAAALLGYDEQISFLNVVERTTGTRLTKSHGFTDWLRRPLSEGQVEYALDDVRYLIPVYHELMTTLCEKDRLSWAAEEFQRLEAEKSYLPPDPDEVYLRVRGVERLSARARAILRALASWREEQAQIHNLPTGRIARDEVLVELARHPRESVKALRDVRGLLPQQIERFGQGLLNAAKRGTTAPPPPLHRPPAFPPALEPTVDFLVLCLRSLANEMSVSPGLVATRSDLTELVLLGAKAEIALMRGWRRRAIGDALLATLEGKATARVIPASRQVHLEWSGYEHGNGRQD